MSRVEDYIDPPIGAAGEAVVDVDVFEVDVPELYGADAVMEGGVLGVEDARQLTDTIRNAAEMLWMLILRAHQGRAWEALGYDTWEGYVRAEFDMSRSRSYQILDQGRVIQAIEGVMPEGARVELSEAAARDLKGVLEEVLPEIAERAGGLDPSEASLVLDEIVEEQRGLIRDERAAAVEDDDDDDFEEYGGSGSGEFGGDGGGGFDGPPDVEDDPIYDDVDGVDTARIRRNVNAAHDVYSALAALASLPDDLGEVARIIPVERRRQIDANLSDAQTNLGRFAEIWSELGSEGGFDGSV